MEQVRVIRRISLQSAAGQIPGGAIAY